MWYAYGGNRMMAGHILAWAGPVAMFIFWVLVVVALVFFIRFLVRQSRVGARSGGTALEILKERYARGEIGKEEFESKCKDLS